KKMNNMGVQTVLVFLLLFMATVKSDPVCPNCFEVDATWIGAVIVLDVVGTVFVMMAIYRCTKKESPAGPTHASKAPGRSGGRGPPVPSPDYELLNVHTRTQDTYSSLS
uniref:DNAX-activation protein 10 n=1 Tax=Monopterus albus TaxID=43700 RepID=A0A3Q3K2M7_MONAL